MALKNYSIRTCNLSLGGVPISSGLVSFTLEPEGDRFADEVSADGEWCRYDTGEIRHTGTLVLKGFSNENEVLSRIHQADVESENGAGVFVLKFKDEQGTTDVLTDEAFIVGMPPAGFSQKREDVTWKIRCGFKVPLSFTVGGN